jgi:hypothetical protein
MYTPCNINRKIKYNFFTDVNLIPYIKLTLIQTCSKWNGMYQLSQSLLETSNIHKFCENEFNFAKQKFPGDKAAGA